MKVAICYPSLESSKGIPLLSQNRQFQWFKVPAYIYPVVPAYGATMLKKAGHEVVWLDGIAEKWSYQEWLEKLKGESADLVFIETKTPVIKQHWKIINSLKTRDRKLKICLAGDHVTALPKESFEKSKVDYVLTGGDYDFLLLNLVEHLSRKVKLEPGIYSRKNLRAGKFKLDHDLNKLPFIDRELTKWKLYAYENGNYKRTPGAYIMSGRDCWWRKNGGCTFCSWTTLYPQFRARQVESVLDEVGELINKYKVREIMDDTGTFPAGKWLKEFCRGMIKRGYSEKVNFSCNLRFGALGKEEYELMAKASFRLLLFGLESASQRTIDKLNKGIEIARVGKELRIAKEASKRMNGHLEPHLTFMVGYPWESKGDARKTAAMARNLFKKRLIDSLQATVVIPYPGTKLFAQAKRNGWLKTENWERYDMKEPVMRAKINAGEIRNLTREIYTSFLTPGFIIRKIVSVRSLEDLKFMFRAAFKLVGHWLDFKTGNA